MKHIVIPVVACVMIAVSVAVIALCPDPHKKHYEKHFVNDIPPGTRLIHYRRMPSGVPGLEDVSYAFVFEVPDNQLLTQLIKEWSLSPAKDDYHDTTSFVAIRPPSWWLNQQALRKLSVQYEWIDRANEQYRSVWVDTANHRLYAELGRW
jgi:hypothetical protein